MKTALISTAAFLLGFGAVALGFSQLRFVWNAFRHAGF